MSIPWSLTSIITFRVCQRKYFFSQVQAKNHKASSPLQKQTFWLKKAITLDMWAGNVIDTVMNTKIIPVYGEKDEPDFKEIENYAIQLLKQQWAFSKNGMYKHTTESAAKEDYCVLDVHENNVPYKKEDLEAVVQRVRQSIQNIQTITLPDGTFLVELLKNADWVAPNKNDRWASVGEANVGPQIDLLFWENNTQYVVDWKVSDGKNSDYSRQLGLIGMVIYRKRSQVFKKKLEEGIDTWMYDLIRTKIILYEVNLFKGYIKEHPFTQSIYGELVDYVHQTAKDIELFKKGRHWNEISLQEYAYTESDYACNTCPYRHLCNFLIENSHEHFSSTNYREFIRASQLV